MRRALVLLFLALGAVPAEAQTATLVGRVTDAAGAPLPGANVYLSGTTRGTATDADGRFRIERVELGAVELVASLLGFETRRRGLRLTRPGPAGAVRFELPERVLELGAVRVEARAGPVHRERLRRFRAAILGETENAALATIENPAVLRFQERGGALGAAVSAPLRITNRALGYRLTYDLGAFELDGGVRYDGQERFDELAPADDAEAARWRAARARAYRGSLRHLLQALAAGRALADGFALTLTPDGTDDRGRPLAPRAVYPTDIFRPSRRVRGWYELVVPGRLEVTYTGEGGAQRSGLRVAGGRALVDPSGTPDTAAALTATGAFAAERLADLVPREYVPPERRRPERR